MFTNFYGVNINNGRFRLTNDVAATELLLPFQNYKNMSDVAAAFAEALRPDFKDYASAVVDNARALAASLEENGLRVVSGGTDNHRCWSILPRRT